MAQIAEQQKKYHVTKEFRGINTKANRTAIDSNEFAWIENFQPIGFSNLKTVPNASPALVEIAGATLYSVHGFNRNNVDYVAIFSGDGSAKEVNLSSNVTANIANASVLSNTGVTIAQWKNERILIATPDKGLWDWDGNNLVSIGSIQTITVIAGGSGYGANTTVTLSAPQQTGGVQATASPIISSGAITSILVDEAGSGYTNAAAVTVTISGTGTNASANVTIFSQNASSIATYSGRTWLADKRNLYYSAPDTYNDFGSTTAGVQTFTDETLHSNITAIESANQYLYVFGIDSINVIGDVRVTGTPAVTVFTNTNITASIGSSNIYSVYPYYRSIMFMNRYGVYSVTGATTTKISDALDGIFESIDFTKPISGGQALINNILCAAFQFTYSGRVIQAVFFDRKWFITSQGATTFKSMAGVQSGGRPNAYAVDDTKLYQLYSNNAANIATTVKTALWPMGDPIRDKQALKIGVEATFANSVGDLTITVDSENQTAQITGLSAATNQVNWTNLALTVIPWVNNSNATVVWFTSDSFQLYKADAEMWGKYLGMTVTSNTPQFTINGLFTEHEMRARF